MAAPFWPSRQGRRHTACMGGHYLPYLTYTLPYLPLFPTMNAPFHVEVKVLFSCTPLPAPGMLPTHLFGAFGPLGGAFRVCRVAGNGDERNSCCVDDGTGR